VFSAASALVEAFLRAPAGIALPNPDHLAPRANRLRQGMRPRNTGIPPVTDRMLDLLPSTGENMQIVDIVCPT